MCPSDEPPPASVRVRRLIPARREQVFDAWLDPAIRRRWWRPAGEGTECLQCDIDPHVGGEFRTIATNSNKAAGCSNFGRFLEIARPERLVFTWSSAIESDGVRDTLVTVEFYEQGGETLVVVTHEQLPARDQSDAHAGGWQRLLDYLAETIELT